MNKEINFGKFVIDNDGELIFQKHCNFTLAILWITKELSLPLTVFEDIRKREVKKIRFINTKSEGELANEVWDFSFEEIDNTKREKKMFQETQYYFSIKHKLPVKDKQPNPTLTNFTRKVEHQQHLS